MGPTASGKSALAMALADALPCEIISVDSALVYRGLDIGAAKPSAAERTRVPHHLIDIRDPSEPYSAAQFRSDALAAMAACTRAGRLPLLVGGTMLYFRALEHGLSELPRADAALRARISAEAGSLGWAVLHARLARVDPDAAQRIHPNDPQRIQRALEVYELTGQTLSALQGRLPQPGLPWRVLKLAVAPAERARLHERIAVRFHAMLEAGLVAEVAALRARGDLTHELPAVRAVGYRQVWEYCEGRYSQEDMTRRAIQASRQLAKRQLTWLRAMRDLVWFDSDAPNLASQVLGAARTWQVKS